MAHRSAGMTLRSHTLSATTLAFMIAAALVAGGCGGNKKAGVEPAATPQAVTVDATDPIALFNARRYREAKERADALAKTSKDRDREVLVLTSGMSAQALGQDDEAKRTLEPLLTSKDPQIVGRAEAALGQIAQRKGQNAYAADLFKRASQKLDGDDAARASMRAGSNLAAAGRPTESTAHYQAAAQTAQNTTLKRTATQLSEPGPFTLQAGAFTNRSNAERRARELNTQAVRAGLAAPVIVPETINGKPGYSVQIGSFPTRQAAAAARSRLGVAVVVTPVGR